MPQFVAFRAVQGVGGGGLMIGAQAIIGEVVSPRERGRYLGLIGGVYVVAAVGGPLVGGFFIDRGSWRWIFAIYPPLGLLAAVVVVRTCGCPSPRRQRADRLRRCGHAWRGRRAGGGPARRVRWHAAAARVDGAGARGGGRRAGAAWLVSARCAADPILPLRLFRDPAFAIPTADQLADRVRAVRHHQLYARLPADRAWARRRPRRGCW